MHKYATRLKDLGFNVPIQLLPPSFHSTANKRSKTFDAMQHLLSSVALLVIDLLQEPEIQAVFSLLQKHGNLVQCLLLIVEHFSLLIDMNIVFSWLCFACSFVCIIEY